MIGDTGEGDASQHVLRDSADRAAGQPSVRFVVISSDVIYPTGAMKDYETKFWLPFKGVKKPVYAIPGNHDWYDALEGFAATFFEPRRPRGDARAYRGGRRAVGTTRRPHRSRRCIAEAAGSAASTGADAGQRAPFFQVQTEDFALLAMDTGVAQEVDPAQSAVARGRPRGGARQVHHGRPGPPVLRRRTRPAANETSRS